MTLTMTFWVFWLFSIFILASFLPVCLFFNLEFRTSHFTLSHHLLPTVVSHRWLDHSEDVLTRDSEVAEHITTQLAILRPKARDWTIWNFLPRGWEGASLLDKVRQKTTSQWSSWLQVVAETPAWPLWFRHCIYIYI